MSRSSTPGTASASSSSPTSWAAARWATGRRPAFAIRPDPVEYVRIRGDQLRPNDGRYDLRVTNELEETLFVDRLQLIAITHPTDVDIFPNEGMTDPPKPFQLFAARDSRPPARAVDDHGHDVTARIASLDRRYPDDFELRARSAATPRCTR